MKYNREEELLVILQEECSEVVQEISKIFRFGKNQESMDNLQKELGDVFAVFKLLIEEGYIDPDAVVTEGDKKIEKLKKNMKNPFPKKTVR